MGLFSKKKEPDAFRLTIPKGITPASIDQIKAEYTTDNPLEYDVADLLGIALISMMVGQPKIFDAYIQAAVKAAFGEDAYDAAQSEINKQEVGKNDSSRLKSNKIVH